MDILYLQMVFIYLTSLGTQVFKIFHLRTTTCGLIYAVKVSSVQNFPLLAGWAGWESSTAYLLAPLQHAQQGFSILFFCSRTHNNKQHDLNTIYIACPLRGLIILRAQMCFWMKCDTCLNVAFLFIGAFRFIINHLAIDAQGWTAFIH